jgi:hypothetical protein
MATAFFVQVGFLIGNYVSFGSKATLKHVYPESMPFPAVTVCSINPFKQNKIGSSQKLTDVSLKLI